MKQDPATAGRALLVVMFDVDPEHEEEFNRWYDEEHFPERKGIPGFLSCRRFRAVQGSPKYIAVYELESLDVLESEAYKAIQPDSERTKAVLESLSTAPVRNIYVDQTPEIPDGYVVNAVRGGDLI
jgi:hypothetical protein